MLDLGIEALLDDREGHRPGAKFADAELVGIPHRIVVGERGLASGTVEYLNRQSGHTENVPVEGFAQWMSGKIAQELG